MYDSVKRTGSILKDKDALWCKDLRAPLLVYTPSTPWSVELQKQMQSGFLRSSALAHKESGLLVLDVPKTADASYMQRLYVDPAHGYLVKRIESFNRGRLVTKDEAVEVSMVAPSVWFPTKWVMVSYDANGAELAREIVEVKALRVNVEIPDDVFVPDFPVGTRVSDMLHNRVFVVTTLLWTFRRTLIALVIIGLLTAFWWWRYRYRARAAAG